MFDGVPHEQLHQFIGSSRATSNPLPLVNPLSSFPLHHNHIVTSTNSQTIASNSFDSYSHHHQLLLNPLQQQQFLQPILHHKSINVVNNNTIIGDKQEQPQRQQEVNNNNNRITEGLVSDVVLDQIERETPIMAEPNNAVDEPWSNDEVMALLRIRSTMESWFPDFTWEHVSRKLAEHGFKMRSAEKCKDKYEEETRYFNNINNCTKNLRPYFLSELEELYNSHTTSQQNHDDDDDDNNNNSATIGPQTTPVESFDHHNNHQDKRGLEDHHHHHDQIHDEIFGAKECSDHQKEEELEDHKVLETTGTTITTNGNNNIMRKRKRPTTTTTSRHNHEKNSTKFEMFKGFCEDIVNKLMAQQEEMHNKLLEDMVKRDQEKLKKEEAWKKSEMDRMNKELEVMAREQAVAGDRQAAIIDFLRKFSSSPHSSDHHQGKITDLRNSDHHPDPDLLVTTTKNMTSTTSTSTSCSLTTPSSSSSLALQSLPIDHHQNPSNGTLASSSTLSRLEAELNPSSDQKKPQNPSPAGTNDVVGQDLGKRWPRDEVLALINLRCSLYDNGDQQQQADHQNNVIRSSTEQSAAKAVPLWERISQGMAEMGYKRSAKRCKEKWENINKYFRKTKDVNKKRSVDSRTCPYFHQLSTLYNKGTLHENNHHHHPDMMTDHDHHLDHDHI